MIVYCDIDGILLTQDKDNPAAYHKAKPIQKNIDKLNKMYYDGHVIILWTARGSISGVDFTDITIDQLDRYGIKYHKLKMDKPFFDVFIDDRARNEL